MTDDDDDNLPIAMEQPRSREDLLDGVDTHVVEVTWYNVRGTIESQQYLVLLLDDAEAGRYVVSDVSLPLEDGN